MNNNGKLFFEDNCLCVKYDIFRSGIGVKLAPFPASRFPLVCEREECRECRIQYRSSDVWNYVRTPAILTCFASPYMPDMSSKSSPLENCDEETEQHRKDHLVIPSSTESIVAEEILGDEVSDSIKCFFAILFNFRARQFAQSGWKLSALHSGRGRRLPGKRVNIYKGTFRCLHEVFLY